MNADGSDPQRLLPQAGTSGAYEQPEWSPDGQLLAFVCLEVAPDGVDAAVCVAAADGSDEPRTLTPPDGSDCFSPRFAPDGRDLAFVCYRQGSEGGDVYVASIEGDDTRQLTTTGDVPMQGTIGGIWSTSGNELYLRRANRLWTVRTDGTGLTPLAFDKLDGAFDLRFE